MLLGSGEGKHLHVDSRFGKNADRGKTFLHVVLPCCLLAVSTSSSPPTRQLQLKATSRGRDSREQEQKEHWSITHHVLPEGEFMSAFLHSCWPFRLPPYRDLFSVQPCTPSNSQRIFFPFFLKRWGQDVEDGRDLFVLGGKKTIHMHNFLPTCTPISAHLLSVLEMNSRLSRWR